MATWAIGKNLPCDTRARSLHYRFYRFNLVWLLCFADDLCQILECFYLLKYWLRNKVRSRWHSGGKYNRQMYVRPTCSNLHRKISVNILTARWRASAWCDKMNKEHLLMIPPWIWFVKNMLNSTISMSYPDVVIACIEYKVSLEAFRAIEVKQ